MSCIAMLSLVYNYKPLAYNTVCRVCVRVGVHMSRIPLRRMYVCICLYEYVLLNLIGTTSYRALTIPIVGILSPLYF